ncbi:YeeE/YedE family protein [Vibrio sp. Isolate23]|uniref:YeeE/YedE family protein n=1 Tax=Vibrio sp. Isolate23 TaxID=2908533 RepID=UPI001EFC6525|nr:YeeE/YedE family protein [Vibrio sp. Isolate23]MCG9681101.1 YeeE/YedE family protein [Vibrio sp. Isolate23]
MSQLKLQMPAQISEQFVALASGIMFGIGMALSGMTNPESVIGFLNVMGDWDPSLAFVMGGALAVFTPIYHFVIKTRRHALLGEPFCLVRNQKVDRRLVSGSILFGTGWGLAGICPGPAITSLSFGNLDMFIFIIAMMTGSLMAKYIRVPINNMAIQRE